MGAGNSFPVYLPMAGYSTIILPWHTNFTRKSTDHNIFHNKDSVHNNSSPYHPQGGGMQDGLRENFKKKPQALREELQDFKKAYRGNIYNSLEVYLPL